MKSLGQFIQKETPNFESLIESYISNFKTGEICRMIGGIKMTFSDEDVKDISRICSQEEVYDILFKRKLGGKPYTEENAQLFISWIKRGWKEQTHFVFIIRDSKNRIIGAIDIKSPDLESSEVGYWADKLASGFMTNALQSLEEIATRAGYKSLYAKVVAHNKKSMGVLERAGFAKRAGSKLVEDREYVEFDRKLV